MTQLKPETAAAHGPALFELEMPPGAVLAHWRRRGRCPAIPREALIVSGTLAVRTPERDEHFGPGDVVRLAAAIDAWTIGQQACVLAAHELVTPESDNRADKLFCAWDFPLR